MNARCTRLECRREECGGKGVRRDGRRGPAASSLHFCDAYLHSVSRRVKHTQVSLGSVVDVPHMPWPEQPLGHQAVAAPTRVRATIRRRDIVRGARSNGKWLFGKRSFSSKTCLSKLHSLIHTEVSVRSDAKSDATLLYLGIRASEYPFNTATQPPSHRVQCHTASRPSSSI